MQKEIAEDPDANVPMQIAQQQMMWPQEEPAPEPEDNVSDADMQEQDNVSDEDQRQEKQSLTPDLDAEVDRLANVRQLNKYKTKNKGN